MEDLKFICPNCRQSLEASSDMAGQLIDCPSCKRPLEVPFANTPATHSANRMPTPRPRTLPGTTASPKHAYSPPRPPMASGSQKSPSSIKHIMMWLTVGICILVIAILGFVYVQEKEVSGSVFIVTQGGENIKLGLVQLRVYNHADIEVLAKPILDKYKGVLADRYQALNAELEAGSRIENQRNENQRRVKENSARLVQWAEERRKTIDGSSTEDMNRLISELNQKQAELEPLAAMEKQLNEEYDAALKRTQHALEAVKSVKDECLYEIYEKLYMNLTAVTSVKSDADGKFRFKVSRHGDYVLAANATRRAGKDEEKYYWLLKLGEIQKSEELLVSNDNLLTGSSGTSVFNLNSILPEPE